MLLRACRCCWPSGWYHALGSITSHAGVQVLPAMCRHYTVVSMPLAASHSPAASNWPHHADQGLHAGHVLRLWFQIRVWASLPGPIWRDPKELLFIGTPLTHLPVGQKSPSHAPYMLSVRFGARCCCASRAAAVIPVIVLCLLAHRTRFTEHYGLLK